LEIFRIVIEDERMTGFEKFDKFALDAGIGGRFAILEVIHLAFEKRVFLEKIENTKWGAADGEDVYAAVVVTLYDGTDFRGAADASQTLGQGEKHAEIRFLREAIFHHGAVTRLKNVQGKLSAGKEDDVQRKKRNAFWPHGSQTKSYQREGEMYGKEGSGVGSK